MLRELKTFITVARLGTFAAAGQQVGLTQSAVSAQMRVLEQHLGVRLFDRSGRAAVLNAAGRHALPFVGAAVVFLSGYAGLAASFFPNIVPYDITYEQAASADNALGLMLVGYLVAELCPGEVPPMFTTSAIASVTLDAEGKGVLNWQMSPCNLKMAKAI